MKAILLSLLALAAASALPFGYQKGNRYTYDYETEVLQAIPGGSAQTLVLRVKALAHVAALMKNEFHIELENIQVKQEIGDLTDPKQIKEEVVKPEVLLAMQEKLKLPVKVILKPQDGRVKEIQAHALDEEWSQNIKRGLVNLLQITLTAEQIAKIENQVVTQHETTAVGECQVAYVITPQKPIPGQKETVAKVMKVINYEKCKMRPDFKQSVYYGQKCDRCQVSMGYVPILRSIGQIEHVLAGSVNTGFIIKRTEATEQHIITPFSESGGQVAARARQILVFKESEVMLPVIKPLPKRIGLMIVPENPEMRWRQHVQYQTQLINEVVALIEKMANFVRNLATTEAAQALIQLVQKLRECNKETLEKVVEKILTRDDQTARRVYLDAVSFVGTDEAFLVLKQKVVEKKLIKPEELDRVFLGLPFAPRPSAKQIDITWELCQHELVKKVFSVRRHCMLAFGALVHKVSLIPSLQQDTKIITAFQQYAQQILDQLASEETTPEEKVMLVKTLGNAGSPKARREILRILKDPLQPLHLRVECVWALRRIIPQAREKAFASLIPIFADPLESPEIRMAVFAVVLDTQPNFFVLQALTNIVRREITNPTPGPRSNQVASFVMSHLSALAYHNNVITKPRSVNARLALRLMPKMSFGLSYSKGMRLAQYSEKFQAGLEFEANKMVLPESMLPRNLNAKMQLHLFGYRINALEFGARIDNMDTVIEQLVSEVQSRHKRSMWGSLLSWFNDDVPETTARTASNRRRASVKGTQRPSTRPTTARKPTTPRPAKPEARRVSAYVKLFGDELRFMEFKQEDIQQLSQDVTDLALGKKERIEYPNKGIVITKDGIQINQDIEKGLVTADARQLIPTLCGIPLDVHHRSAAVVKLNLVANIKTDGSLFSLWNVKKLTITADVKPSVGVHVDSQVGLHTPLLHIGLRMKTAVHADPVTKVDAVLTFAKNYDIKYHAPKKQRDVLRIDSDAKGFIFMMNPITCVKEDKEIAIEFYAPHLAKIERSCAGANLFGVQVCAEGQVPDIPALRLQQIPVFPTVALTKLRVTMAPAADLPSIIQFTSQVTENDVKGIRAQGAITASSKTVTRRIPYRVIYTRNGPKQAEQQLVIESREIDAPEYQNSMLVLTAKPMILKDWRAVLEFGVKEPRYQITLEGSILNEGKKLLLRSHWTKCEDFDGESGHLPTNEKEPCTQELPEKWVKFFYNWEPQILYFLQQFAWVKRPALSNKEIALEFELTSAMTARMRLLTPNVEALRNDMSLPVRVDRLPSSLQEIKSYFYAQCEVQQHSIRMFDQIQIQHNIRGKCPYVLVQDRRKDQQTRIQVSLKIDEQGQKILTASIQQPEQTKIQIQSDSTVMIDGEKKECEKQACQSKQGTATVHVVKQQDGKTRVQLSTRIGLHATVEGQRIQLFASPLLRGRVRGLCGDANGEQYNEYKDPKEQVQHQVEKFIESWKLQQC